MIPQGYEFQSELARTSLEKGHAEGRAAEKAADVLAVLEARGLVVTEAQRERVLGCSDLDSLDHWLRRAATVAAADKLFE